MAMSSAKNEAERSRALQLYQNAQNVYSNLEAAEEDEGMADDLFDDVNCL